MTNLVIPVGIPGTGKSAWAKSLFDLKYATVSSDQIRIELFGSLKNAHAQSSRQRKRVWEGFFGRIEEFLSHGVDVYADATNLKAFYREKLRSIANEQRAKTHLLIFDNLTQGVTNNEDRDPDECVPDDAMALFEMQYDTTLELILSGEESYDSITTISAVFMKPDLLKPINV